MLFNINEKETKGMKLFNKAGSLAILSAIFFTFCIGNVLAQTEKNSEAETFQATVICLGCTLKKTQGAKAQCSLYGHVNALKTADDKIWTILENDTSVELINSHEYAGKKVEITGKKFSGSQVIEIEKVVIKDD